MYEDTESYTEDEIREQLTQLGYTNIPDHRLRQFKKDLDILIQHERSKNSTGGYDTSHLSSYTEPPSQHEYDTGYGRDSYATGGYERQQRRGEDLRNDVADARYDKENLYDGYQQSRNGTTKTTHPKLDTYRIPESHTYRSKEPKQYMDSRSKTYNTTTGLRKEFVKPTDINDFSMYSTDSWVDSENDVQNDQDDNDRYNYSDVINRYDKSRTVPKVLDETTDSSRSQGKRQIKRKTLRRKDGAKVVDESITESEPDLSADLRYLNEKLSRLPLHNDGQLPDRATYNYRRPQSAREPPYRLDPDYEGPTALIRPLTQHPHKKNIKKNDPVRRYQEYKQAWVSQKAPGEKQHKGLRWNVREQMLYQDELPKKTQRVLGPNTYVVPTEKKRKALRWQVRNDIAQGLMPPTNFDLYDI